MKKTPTLIRGGNDATTKVTGPRGDQHSVAGDDIDGAIRGGRSSQLSIKGTEQKVPPGLLRQARKWLDLRDAAEIAKARADAAHDFLLSMMAKEAVPRFVLDEPNMPSPIVFRIDQPEQKVKCDGYKKPQLPDLSSAVG